MFETFNVESWESNQIADFIETTKIFLTKYFNFSIDLKEKRSTMIFCG